jgi:predicted small lipoprotein YifL
MSVVLDRRSVALVLLALAGCGARSDLDLVGQQDAAAVDAREEAPSSPTDASAASDTSYEIDCAPTESDPTGCSGKAYCVAWVFADGAAPSGQYPDNVVRSACESGPVPTVCDGNPPLYYKYDPYDNYAYWAVCAEP